MCKLWFLSLPTLSEVTLYISFCDKGKAKEWNSTKGPPPKPNQKCKCIYHDHPQKLPPGSAHAFHPFFVQRWRETARKQLCLKSTSLCEFRKWIMQKPLPAQIHPGLLHLKDFILFLKKCCVGPRYNSRTLSLCQLSEFSSQHQPVFCISSFQTDLWHFNFRRGRLVSLN